MINQLDFTKKITNVVMLALKAGKADDWDMAMNLVISNWNNVVAEVADLYAELEHESYEREQFEVELNKANKRLDGMKKFYHFYGSKLTEPDEEVPGHHDAFDAMFPGCTPDDLPFPDVEDLAPASEVMGGEE